MVIAEQILKAYGSTSLIKNPEKPLKGIRFSDSHQNDDYIHIYQDGLNIVCRNGADYISIPDALPLQVAEEILLFFEKLTEWNGDLQDMISQGCSLKDLIDRSVAVMENPMFVIDDSDIIRAISSHGVGEVNDDWDYIVENGTVVLEMMQKVFSEPSYRKKVISEAPHPFYLKPKGAINGAINYRIPAPNGQSTIGSLVIFEGLTPITPAMLQYVTILSKAVVLWFKLNSGKLPMFSAKDVLIELLDSGSLGITGEAILKNMIGSQKNRYVLIAASGEQDANLQPYLVHLEEQMPHSIFCMYQERLISLTSADDGDRHAALIEHLLKIEKAAIGISHPFINLKTACNYLSEALIALEYGNKSISTLNAEIIMRYIAHGVSTKIRNISIVHPALLTLKNYDDRHGSDYYKTLYVYLVTERSIAASLHFLNIHRNTMAFRLERLSSLIDAQLDDPAVREWLLLSYRLSGVPE